LSYLCSLHALLFLLFFFNAPAPTELYTLSLHDALPISWTSCGRWDRATFRGPRSRAAAQLRQPSETPASKRRGNAEYLCQPDARSEEHTSELQSRSDLVCRLLLEKKKQKTKNNIKKQQK